MSLQIGQNLGLVTIKGEKIHEYNASYKDS